MAANIYIRYKQVEQQCRDHLLPDTNRVLSRNRLALFVGLLSCLGLSIVANFQELQLFTIHLIGGFSAFGFGLVYLWLQTHSSYMMYPIVKSGLFVARVRLALSIILTCTFIVSGVLGPLSMRYFHGRDPTKWQPDDGGYLFHVISSISEWLSAFAIDFFILSFAHEFKYMSISSPKFYILSTVINIEERRSIDSNYGINVVTSDISRTQRVSRQARNRDLMSRYVCDDCRTNHLLLFFPPIIITISFTLLTLTIYLYLFSIHFLDPFLTRIKL